MRGVVCVVLAVMVAAAAAAAPSVAGAQKQPQQQHEEAGSRFLALGGVRGGVPDEYAGYTTVDAESEAALFWWGYGATNVDRPSAPLVLWLQGGPGGTSFYGDIVEGIGPLDVFGQPNEHTWVEERNLLFIDNPVGTGFSYTKVPSAYVRNEIQVSRDIVSVLKEVVAKVPVFEDTPFFIAAESYGPKYTVHAANALLDAIAAGELSMNFKGVALGDGWIDPLECVRSYCPYLRALSLATEVDCKTYNEAAAQAEGLMEMGNTTQAIAAGNLVNNLQNGFLLNSTGAPSYFNFYKHENATISAAFAPLFAAGGRIRTKYGSLIPSFVSFDNQTNEVFNALLADFLRPAVDQVDKLLASGLDVVVYNGQLDVIVPVLCTEGWIRTLSWPGLSGFQQVDKKFYTDDSGLVSMFRRTYKNFSLYNILRAGHLAPRDQGGSVLTMIDELTGVAAAAAEQKKQDAYAGPAVTVVKPPAVMLRGDTPSAMWTE